ncbi:MAG: polyprenyl synthetase family protein, partial [Candidatus Levybacteria bacterium]|nr:polyprenyl synthetase family protein [Candidatus Levybacteria bacterium]
AAAHEIFHTAILAHDDVIDQSATRRGKPSLHKAIGDNHYGVSQAISLGDAGFFLAMKIIAESKFSESVKNKALRIFTDSMLDTAVGEMLDVALPKEKNLKEKDVLKIAMLKTARYSFAAPLTLGAKLNHPEGELDLHLPASLDRFGINLGIAFQIQDDILGIFGDEKETGKSVQSDISEGKITFLLTHALKHADKKMLDFLKRNYGKGDIAKTDAKKIREIFVKTGAYDYSRKKVNYYSENARIVLEKLTINNYFRKILREFINELMERKH